MRHQILGFFILLVAVSSTIWAQSEPKTGHPDLRVRVSAGVLKDITVHRVLPEFPAGADKSLVNERVVAWVLVDYDGTVKSVKIREGNAALAETAVEAIKQWRFRPYTIDGKSVQVESQIILKFRKKGAEQVFE